MKLGKQIRKIVMLCMIAVIVGCLGGCGTELSEKFDEDKVKEAAEAIVEKVNAGNLKESMRTRLPRLCKTVWLLMIARSLVMCWKARGNFRNFPKWR